MEMVIWIILISSIGSYGSLIKHSIQIYKIEIRLIGSELELIKMWRLGIKMIMN